MLKEKLVQFRDYLIKDTARENESKGVIISLRLVTLCILFYLIIIGILFLGFLFKELNNIRMIWILLICFSLYIIVFILTYRTISQISFNMFTIATYLWTILFIVMLGWNCGVQHFLFPLVIFCFFASYDNYLRKFIYTALLAIFRLSLFLYCRHYDPLILIYASQEVALQIVNTLFIFTCTAIICWFFSSNTQATEKKLFLYNQRLQQEVSTDPLTKLLNRRKMMVHLQESVEKLYDNNFSVAIGDIDLFKKINDTWGHDCGDIVLQEMASLFEEHMNEKGYVARWGGEEFLFLFENMNGDAAAECIQSLITKIRNYNITYKNETLHVTMTFGLEEYDILHGLTKTIKSADDKLYIGKNSGRNRLVY